MSRHYARVRRSVRCKCGARAVGWPKTLAGRGWRKLTGWTCPRCVLMFRASFAETGTRWPWAEIFDMATALERSHDYREARPLK